MFKKLCEVFYFGLKQANTQILKSEFTYEGFKKAVYENVLKSG